MGNEYHYTSHKRSDTMHLESTHWYGHHLCGLNVYKTAKTVGLPLIHTRHPSLYLALHARPWLRMSQSYDLSDVNTTLMLLAAATVCSRTQSWQWVSWNVASWPGPTAAVAVVRKPRPTVNICSPDTRPSPKKTVAYVCASAGWLRGRVSGKGSNVKYQLRWRWGLQPRST